MLAKFSASCCLRIFAILGKPERLSPRCSSQQGDGRQTVRTACRQALVHLLLLIPKNLTPLRALRFSGTPLFFKGTPRICASLSPLPQAEVSANRGGTIAPNTVNFAERPLAGIHAKLTMLRDNLLSLCVVFGRAIIKNIKPQTHGKSQRNEIFVNKDGGAEAETSNARQGIVRNRPRAKPRQKGAQIDMRPQSQVLFYHFSPPLSNELHKTIVPARQKCAGFSSRACTRDKKT